MSVKLSFFILNITPFHSILLLEYSYRQHFSLLIFFKIFHPEYVFSFFHARVFLTDSFVFRKDESDNELLYTIGHVLHDIPDQHPKFPVASVQRKHKNLYIMSFRYHFRYTESK